MHTLSDAWFPVSTPGSGQAVNEAHAAHTSMWERSLNCRHRLNQSPLCFSQFCRACVGITHTEKHAQARSLSNKHRPRSDIHTVYTSTLILYWLLELCQNRVRPLMRLNDPDHKHRPLPPLPTDGINEAEFLIAPFLEWHLCSSKANLWYSSRTNKKHIKQAVFLSTTLVPVYSIRKQHEWRGNVVMFIRSLVVFVPIIKKKKHFLIPNVVFQQNPVFFILSRRWKMSKHKQQELWLN